MKREIEVESQEGLVDEEDKCFILKKYLKYIEIFLKK